MRESFIFYASFYRAIEEIEEKKQLKIYKAIMKLALENEEIENLSGIEKAIFELIKPQIIANNKRYDNGAKGGRPPKKITNGYENKKPKENQNETKTKPNNNYNENENENVNVNDNYNGNEINTPHPYGNFQNVYLTDKQKAEFECLVMDKKTSDTLIENLSESIASKKEQIFDENYPDMHLIRLKKYWQYWRSNPQSHKNHLSMSQVENLVDKTIKQLAERKSM